MLHCGVMKSSWFDVGVMLWTTPAAALGRHEEPPEDVLLFMFRNKYIFDLCRILALRQKIVCGRPFLGDYPGEPPEILLALWGRHRLCGDEEQWVREVPRLWLCHLRRAHSGQCGAEQRPSYLGWQVSYQRPLFLLLCWSNNNIPGSLSIAHISPNLTEFWKWTKIYTFAI